jgi:iron complex outermembrane receptor protein
VSGSPVDELQLDLALRHEDFSDFGSTTIWKATGRYDFNPMIAIRGTASTGFRAPTQAEGYYSGINVGPSSIGGQLAPNSPGAALLGKPGLGPEKSKSVSAGLVLHPMPRMTVTLDAYRIKIKDRIVGSGTLIGDASNRSLIRSPVILQALSANGVVIDQSIFSNSTWQISASLFTNGLDTLTKGIDFLMTYSSNFGDLGRVDWSLSANLNDTQVTRILPPLPSLTAGATLFDVAAISNLEDSSPQYRVVAGALYTRGPLTLNVKANLWGRQAAWGRGPQDAIWHRSIVHPSITADAEISYGITPDVRLAFGAQNLFNKYPDKTNETIRAQQLATNSNSYVTPWANGPYGYFGGFYYGRLNLTF